MTDVETDAVSAEPHVVLVGLMATGKTTVGRILAAELGRPLLDSDEQVEARTGRTVRELFASEGEPAFRAHETAALADAVDAPVPAVIAGAGGVVLAETNRRLLAGEDTIVVWLRAAADTVLARLRAGRDEHRPLLDDDPDGTIHAMVEQRTPLYAEVADVVVDVEDRTPDQVAIAVLEALGHAPAGRT